MQSHWFQSKEYWRNGWHGLINPQEWSDFLVNSSALGIQNLVMVRTWILSGANVMKQFTLHIKNKFMSPPFDQPLNSALNRIPSHSKEFCSQVINIVTCGGPSRGFSQVWQVRACIKGNVVTIKPKLNLVGR